MQYEPIYDEDDVRDEDESRLVRQANDLLAAVVDSLRIGATHADVLKVVALAFTEFAREAQTVLERR